MEPDVSDKVHEIDLKKTMEQSYIDYVMNVISARALSDVRDSLKPVQRHVLYSTIELNNGPDEPHCKYTRIVDDTMGKYHPHGDSSIYGVLASMTQKWSTRYPLVDGHGSFGSVDGDSAAATRYTGACLSKISMEMLSDTNEDTVDFVPNFDKTEKEPVVSPSRYPNLLANGTSGTAARTVTNVPPHNLREIMGAVVKMIDNRVEEGRETTLGEIMEIVKESDFPTGATILGRRGIEEVYRTDRAKVRVRAVTNTETMSNGKSRVIMAGLPYMVNKTRLIEKIADFVEDKKINGIAYIGDESNHEGMHIDIELRRDVNANIILDQLLKHTQLQDTSGVIMLALINNEPKVLNIHQMSNEYLKHQEEVVRRRTQYDLNKAKERTYILQGLLIVLDRIDEVIRIIRGSANVADAKNQLMERSDLSDAQSQVIVDVRLRAFTGSGRKKLENECRELQTKIEELKAILADEKKFLTVIREEISIISDKYGGDRRTVIGYDDDIFMENLIPDEDTVIAITHLGYIERMDADNFRNQNRGGKGIKEMQTIEKDYIEDSLMATNHHFMMFFTNKGRVHRSRAYEIPEAGRTTRGTAIINLLQLQFDEKITTIIPIRKYNEDKYLSMVTKNSIVKKTPTVEYEHVRKNGLQAIVLRKDSELIKVKDMDSTQDIFLVTRKGMCIRFNETDVRVTGRVPMGAIGMCFEEDDEVIGMQMGNQGENLLVVSENGMGRRTIMFGFSTRNRGGEDVVRYKCTDKTGNLVGARLVSDGRGVMIITTEGIIIRMAVDDVSVISRNTSGVKLMNINQDSNTRVASTAKVHGSVTRDSNVYDKGFYEDKNPDSDKASSSDADPEETV